MKKILLAILMGMCLLACSDDKDVLVPLPNDVTFNELSLDRFSFNKAESGFSARAAHVNGVTMHGFAYSNRNNRSFTWTNTKTALDSNIFSVYTRRPNAGQVFAVGCLSDGESWFTLESPAVVEHILVANTTYNYLALTYGDVLGTPEKPEVNPNLPGGSNKKSIWHSWVPGGVKKMVDEDQDYFKLIVKGYRSEQIKGEVEFYLCTRRGDTQHPDWSWVRDDWYKVDLSALGEVDKVAFELKSSDMEEGRMRTPAYFCLDGIRIQN